MNPSKRGRKRGQASRAPESKTQKPEPSKSDPATSGGRGRLILLLSAGAVLVGVAAYVRYHAESNPLLRIPQVETRDILPTVAREIDLRVEEIKTNPDSAEAWGMYGLVLLAHDFRNEAAICFAEAEQLDNEDYRWPYYYGMTLGTIDAEKSLRAFERAVEINPERITLRLRLAEWQFDLRMLDECEKGTARALEQEPNNPRALVLMARLKLHHAQLKESLELAERAAKSPRGNRRDVHELLARLYARLDRPEEAQKAVELAEALPRGAAVWDDPEMGFGGTMMRDSSYLNALATMHRARGQSEQWLKMLRQIVTREPDNMRAKEKLAHALLELKLYDQATEFIDQTLQTYPSFSQFECLRGQVDMAQGNVADARARFERATKLKRDYDEAYMWLGRALAAQDRHPEAIVALKESVRLSPSLAEGHHALGLAYSTVGQPDKALESLRNAADLKPGDLTIALHLAKALMKADRGDEAAEILQAIIGTAEDPAEAEELLKKLNEPSEPVKPESNVTETGSASAPSASSPDGLVPKR